MTEPGINPAAASELGAAVFAAQIDHLYRQLPRVLAYSLLVMLLLAFMLRDGVPVMQIAGWVAAMLVVLVLRAMLYLRYRLQHDEESRRHWARRFVVLAGISGLAWGMAGVVLFAPERLELQALILLVLAGMGAGSAAVLPMYLPAFYAYFPLSMIPAGIMMFTVGDSFHVFMGIFDVIFMLGLLTFGRAVGEAFRSSLELRYENLELVRALQEQTGELERANLAKSKFLAAASHDLRQPMHALTLFAEVLDQRATDAGIRSLVDSIRTSVSALDRLFDALLDISRLDAGVLKPDISVFRVQDVLDRVIGDTQPQADEKGLELLCRQCTCYTESDPVLLERILRNLLGNAIRYTPAGSVTVDCHCTGETVGISVSDTGIGIPADQQEIIFQEFSQLGNPERDRAKGLGLGLSIVRRLAMLLHHPLELHSTPGEGTTFLLRLPLREAPAADRGRAKTPASSVPEKLDFRVLVVDDDPEARAGMCTLLESWGCRVTSAASAEEAEAVFGPGRPGPDVMIVDFRLPDNRSGISLVRHVHEELDAAVAALLITGDTGPSHLREARRHGIELLHKPVAPAQLRSWLNHVIRR